MSRFMQQMKRSPASGETASVSKQLPAKFPDGSKPQSDKLSRAIGKYSEAEEHIKKAKETIVIDAQVKELLSAARALNWGISYEFEFGKGSINQERVVQLSLVLSEIKKIVSEDPPPISYKTICEIERPFRACLLGLENYEAIVRQEQR